MSQVTKPVILLCEDNKDMLYNLKIMLEFNEYDVIMADNGKTAMTILSTVKKIPDLIISDIVMPEMNGYDFFQSVSNDPLLDKVPFFFLSALKSPEDIRFAHLLGVDDYLTKPFSEENLINLIAQKLTQVKMANMLSQNLAILDHNVTNKALSTNKTSQNVFFTHYEWNTENGNSELQTVFPITNNSISEIGSQLFKEMISASKRDYIRTQGILLEIKKFKCNSYLYFDSSPSVLDKGGQRLHLFSCIAPKISYMESLKIKWLFRKFFMQLRMQIPIGSAQNCWKQLISVFQPSINEQHPNLNKRSSSIIGMNK